MTKPNAAASGGSGLNPSGAVGYSGLINTEENVPNHWRPAIGYINSRGHIVDAYGNRLRELPEGQSAGVSGSPEQKASTQYNVPELEDESSTNLEDDE